jgi:hypothetical protein
MSTDDRLRLAAERFARIHAEDPGHRAATYHDTLVSWVERLEPRASQVVLLAAHCQHLRRYETPRSSFPDDAAGYRRWRSAAARRHAEDAGVVLREVGYGDDVVARVADLLTKKGLRSDPDAQLLEDAVCLTFLELELEAFAAKHPVEKVVDILKKTWAKMTPRGHEAAHKLAHGLPMKLTTLIAEATG